MSFHITASLAVRKGVFFRKQTFGLENADRGRGASEPPPTSPLTEIADRLAIAISLHLNNHYGPTNLDHEGLLLALRLR